METILEHAIFLSITGAAAVVCLAHGLKPSEWMK